MRTKSPNGYSYSRNIIDLHRNYNLLPMIPSSADSPHAGRLQSYCMFLISSMAILFTKTRVLNPLKPTILEETAVASARFPLDKKRTRYIEHEPILGSSKGSFIMIKVNHSLCLSASYSPRPALTASPSYQSSYADLDRQEG